MINIDIKRKAKYYGKVFARIYKGGEYLQFLSVPFFILIFFFFGKQKDRKQ